MVGRLFDFIHRALVLLAQVLLGAMVAIISTNVFLRYVFDSGLPWSEEIALLCVVWFTFIAMALGVRYRLHISVNVLPRNLPRVPELLLRRLTDLVVLGVGAVMLVFGWILVRFTSRSIMPASGLPSSLLYLAVPVAAVLIIWDSLAGLAGRGGAGPGPEAMDG
jgi:TRAP-type transport system small permease protein